MSNWMTVKPQCCCCQYVVGSVIPKSAKIPDNDTSIVSSVRYVPIHNRGVFFYSCPSFSLKYKQIFPYAAL